MKESEYKDLVDRYKGKEKTLHTVVGIILSEEESLVDLSSIIEIYSDPSHKGYQAADQKFRDKVLKGVTKNIKDNTGLINDFLHKKYNFEQPTKER